MFKLSVGNTGRQIANINSAHRHLLGFFVENERELTKKIIRINLTDKNW